MFSPGGHIKNNAIISIKYERYGEKSAMKIEQFTEWTFAHNPQAVENGQQLFWQTTKANLKENQYDTQISVFDLKNKQIRNLTNSDQDSFLCFQDYDKLLFTSKRNLPAMFKTDQQDHRTYVWEINTREPGEAQLAFAIDLNISAIDYLGNDQFLILGNKQIDRSQAWTEIDELPFWLNGADFTNGIVNELYLFDAKKAGQQLKEIYNASSRKVLDNILTQNKVTDHEQTKTEQSTDENILPDQFKSGILSKISRADEKVSLYALSPDKKQILYGSVGMDKKIVLKEDIHLLNLENKERFTLSQKIFQIYSFQFINQSKAFMIATDTQKHGLNEDCFVYLMDLEKLSIEKISKDDFDYSFGNSVGTDAKFGGGNIFAVENGDLYFIATEKDQANLKKISQKGDVSNIVQINGAITGFQFIDHQLFFCAMENLQLSELYCLELGRPEQLTNYSEVLSSGQLCPIEKFEFKSNGATLDGFVIKPANYQAGKKYPALLEIHGGPKTSYGMILHHEMQLLANLGYFVFFTNPHGSDGYGVAFSDIRGRYGTIDYQDLMNFTDLVLEKYPAIDPQKLGCLGGSYGGFMVNWIIGHTDRFAAANSQRSISNWLSFYGVSDIGFYFAEDQTASDPWTNPEKSWEHSPLKYADQAKTPTLFIHADHDYRCPLEQGIQMYAALKKHDIPAKLTIFKNENHELSRSGKPQARIKRLAEIINWFDTYLKQSNIS